MLSSPHTRGIRGAVTVEENTESAIVDAACRLTQAIIEQNELKQSEIACMLFTVTQDLDAAFPAAGARKAGLTQTALMCTNEIPVADSLEKCIRVLTLVSTNLKQEEIRHVYLGKAAALRPDWVDSAETEALPTTTPPFPTPSFRPTILDILPYQPGKPISELKRERDLNDVIKLASNENPLGPSPKALKAIKNVLNSLHIYPDGSCFELRQKLAQRFNVDGTQLLFGNGSDEVIKMFGLTFLESGDKVLFCEPTFSEYTYATKLMGASKHTAPLADYAFDLNALLKAIDSSTKLIFVCNPNNPTGAYLNHADVAKFLDKVPEHVLVVFDEAYYEYVTAEDFVDSLSFVREGRNVAVLRTFSKIYGLAGLRIGYGVAPKHIAELVHRVREPFNVNALAQIGALAALDDEDHVEQSRRQNQAGKEYLYRELADLNLEFIPTQANFIFFDLDQNAGLVFEKLLDKGIICRKGEVFGCPTWLRVTIGTETENRRFISALKTIL